jgi:hypothetical protein
MLRMAMVVVTIGKAGFKFMAAILGCAEWFVNGKLNDPAERRGSRLWVG